MVQRSRGPVRISPGSGAVEHGLALAVQVNRDG